jgi:hypothetical protein
VKIVQVTRIAGLLELLPWGSKSPTEVGIDNMTTIIEKHDAIDVIECQ